MVQATVPTFNSCTEFVGTPGMVNDCRLDFTQVHGHTYMVDLTTERNFDSQATCVIDVLGLFFDMLSMCVRTTRRWQTSGRLVQEVNVCTVHRHLRNSGALCLIFRTKLL